MDYSSDQVLERLSRQHHQALEFCQRIRRDLLEDVPLDQIHRYAKGYWQTYLEPHFQMEQHCLYPLLGPHNVRIKRAVAQQRRLSRLFHKETDLRRVLNQAEEELAAYVRFEQRALQREIADEVKKLNQARVKSCQQRRGNQKECLWSSG